MSAARRTVVFGFLGTAQDRIMGPKRWQTWRPTVSLGQHGDELPVDKLVLIHQHHQTSLAKHVFQDFARVSPRTELVHHAVTIEDPWDFDQCYALLDDLAQSYPFDRDAEDYLVHVTTGTVAAHICLFLMAYRRDIPARVIETFRVKTDGDDAGGYRIFDLDLSRHPALSERFAKKRSTTFEVLKDGIATQNARYNKAVEEISFFALAGSIPILLLGEPGTGKSVIAERIYAVKKAGKLITGPLVIGDCTLVRGDTASSALFGHEKGAFTGAQSKRAGWLLKADQGMLFLDEIGELGLEQQAMLLRAIQFKSFMPLGSDELVQSDFHLVAGTNRDLRREVALGRFRADLLARIDLLTFTMPPLRARREDIEPNIDYELAKWSTALGRAVVLTHEARRVLLEFALDPATLWPGNFRELSGMMQVMSLRATSGRIGLDIVRLGIDDLREKWDAGREPASADRGLPPWLRGTLHRVDRTMLLDVIRACASSPTRARAATLLFAVEPGAANARKDDDRLRKLLARFGLSFEVIKAEAAGWE